MKFKKKLTGSARRLSSQDANPWNWNETTWLLKMDRPNKHTKNILPIVRPVYNDSKKNMLPESICQPDLQWLKKTHITWRSYYTE